jgi:hypothetical protein
MNSRSIHSLRSLICAGYIALSLIAVLPLAAQAAAPIHTQISFTNPNDNVCGILVSTTVTGVDNFSPVFDSNGLLIAFRDTSQFIATFTAATGKSVEVSAGGLTVGSLTANPDGTFTGTVTFKGLPERISTPGGPLLTRDAGIITFIEISDASGNTISLTVTEAGPHPEADSGFALFCQVVTPLLS